MESTREPLRTIDRRRFLQLGIGGAACLLWPNHTALAKANSHYQKLLIRFRTDPERIARMLPPLNIEQSHIDEAVAALGDTCAALAAAGGGTCDDSAADPPRFGDEVW